MHRRTRANESFPQSSDGTYPGNDLETALSHYWGGFPTAFFAEYVLGVRPTVPGFKEFVVAPLSDWPDEWVSGRIREPVISTFGAKKTTVL